MTVVPSDNHHREHDMPIYRCTQELRVGDSDFSFFVYMFFSICSGEDFIYECSQDSAFTNAMPVGSFYLLLHAYY